MRNPGSKKAATTHSRASKGTKPRRSAAARRPATPSRQTARKTGSDTKEAAPQTLAAQQAAERFVENVLVRGEACKPDAQGNLQPGCTHEIVSQEPGQPPQIKRRRFSII